AQRCADVDQSRTDRFGGEFCRAPDAGGDAFERADDRSEPGDGRVSRIGDTADMAQRFDHRTGDRGDLPVDLVERPVHAGEQIRQRSARDEDADSRSKGGDAEQDISYERAVNSRQNRSSVRSLEPRSALSHISKTSHMSGGTDARYQG